MDKTKMFRDYIETKGFREANEDYFNFVLCISEGTRQVSPFMLYKNGRVEAIYDLKTLIGRANPNNTILQAWPGKWRTDVFAFKMSELLLYKKDPEAFRKSKCEYCFKCGGEIEQGVSRMGSDYFTYVDFDLPEDKSVCRPCGLAILNKL